MSTMTYRVSIMDAGCTTTEHEIEAASDRDARKQARALADEIVRDYATEPGYYDSYLTIVARDTAPVCAYCSEAAYGLDGDGEAACAAHATTYGPVACTDRTVEDRLCHTTQVEADEPECTDGHAHDWRAPRVRSNGGGVIIREVCAHCGVYRVVDTWAQRRDTGEQGLTEVRYEAADDASGEWVQSLRA